MRFPTNQWPPQFGKLRAPLRVKQKKILQASGIEPGPAERRSHMAFGMSVVAGLFVLGYCLSRLKANREEKKNFQTLLINRLSTGDRQEN
jgi:hypothetical protein